MTIANIIVTGTQIITTSLGDPAIRVTVKNTGELAAYNVLVKICDCVAADLIEPGGQMYCFVHLSALTLRNPFSHTGWVAGVIG